MDVKIVLIFLALAAATLLCTTSVVLGTIGLKTYRKDRDRGKTLGILGILFSCTAFLICLIFWIQAVQAVRTELFLSELQVAETALEQNEYEDCLGCLSDLKEKNRSMYERVPQASYIEGMACFGLEDYSGAISCLETSLKLEDNAECYCNLAVSYARAGNTDWAASMLERLDDENDMKTYIQAEVYAEQGELDKAAAAYRAVISATADETMKRNAYIGLARLYKSRRHEDKNTMRFLREQISVMEEAARELQNEDDLTLTEMMGEAYFTGQEYNLAVIKFKRLLELGYERPYIYRNIAIIYQQMDDLQQAEQILLEMKAKYPENCQCYIQLVFVYLDMESRKNESERNYARAEETYRLAVRYAQPQEQNELAQLERKMEELKQKGWI